MVSGKLLHFDLTLWDHHMGSYYESQNHSLSEYVLAKRDQVQWCLQVLGNWEAALSGWGMENMPETPALIFCSISKNKLQEAVKVGFLVHGVAELNTS